MCQPPTGTLVKDVSGSHKDGKAVISSGRNRVEVPVKVEENGAKYRSTSVRYQNGDGKYRLTEIQVGGTSTKLVVN
ncbi:MAG: hypothetical protein FJW39_27870 [Acidobacteria bacterium]|nr:hypothetical protein [Acidobacteriota bacterium]